MEWMGGGRKGGGAWEEREERKEGRREEWMDGWIDEQDELMEGKKEERHICSNIFTRINIHIACFWMKTPHHPHLTSPTNTSHITHTHTHTHTHTQITHHPLHIHCTSP